MKVLIVSFKFKSSQDYYFLKCFSYNSKIKNDDIAEGICLSLDSEGNHFPNLAGIYGGNDYKSQNNI